MLNKKDNFMGHFFKKLIEERRATPNFDGSPVLENDLATILNAGMESPSGFNLQPWRFIVVRTEQQKQRLCEAAMGQPKVKEAGAVIVCCGDLNATRGHNLEKIFNKSVEYGFSSEQNAKAKTMINSVFNAPAGNVMGLEPDYGLWINRHVMVAFTTMMWMSEALGYDTAPMEGFFEDKVKAVLSIPEDIRVVALLGIGKKKGPDKLYAGRHAMHEVCFDENWGKGLTL